MADRSYPVLLKLKDKPCVIVGGGNVAERKVLALLEAAAAVTVVSPTVTWTLKELAESGRIVWCAKTFEPSDIAGAFLVFAATNQPEINLAVYRALGPGQLITIADRPDLSMFTVPAQLRRGRLLLAAATEGASPGLASKIIGELTETYDEAYELYTDFLAESRAVILQQVEQPSVRQRLFKRLLDEQFLRDAREGDAAALWRRFKEIMAIESRKV
ncbi:MULTISPECIES: bifunctional precorrin-2 dehydrogenase/sirohydrochlorin ferrochelatase [Aneurinibacillus]|uniref:precorrin-2 dehydrogenase n=1 Tax=Aneurinibacillus thermoaerophilus TaxID=143495 RepID=A0A1G8CME1_ANETH|nr:MULTISPECIES: NAD(P)-dependent oxidoreductase [Aneurinibacillus]AMA71897.1 hypothetical protein ACH33_02950 [Aneurinibacillus sp. XH2]MED0675555.1 NAD(P)-dependent oxidoreductase [Aneurinibacillus thermoaerophilus]MED0680322.1 NAD(P)-dependent oxidoreductase [Aneurinibacillus thermoaerophilus]MED0737051.1 NAD(P)-dependent oxidoreductase [Aneurinibacillus thermoaerophilus]MED0757379.1 NAD(P)-dependent oxidoreductase [Aneurinibacillus thermoaerophilus]